MNRRVVVTGLGVVAPNAVGIPAFLEAIQKGQSGIRFIPRFEELKFSCQVGGFPEFEKNMLAGAVSDVVLHGLRVHHIGYGLAAAIEAWLSAGLKLDTEQTRYETGCVFGNSGGDIESMKQVIEKVDHGEVRKLGSRVVEQSMNSGVTSYITGRLGLGNKIVTNSAACATGTQAVLMGYEYISHGYAERMVVGSTEHIDTYVFGAFDSMRVLSRKFNHEPGHASRPMSASAGGFVPGSGAGALILEDLEVARKRGAPIYAEMLGGASNSGGQRNQGSMTAPNSEGVKKCIEQALNSAGIAGSEVDSISGHLTATMADAQEIKNWTEALGRSGKDFPVCNSLKSMIGHCLSAAGSIETVAAVLQLQHQFMHPNLNLEDLNPEIEELTSSACFPRECIGMHIDTIAKANFGFGDVNTCLIFSKYKE